MRKRTARKKPSIEQRIKARLADFRDALRDNEKVTERFTCRTVVLDLEPMSYKPETVVTTRKLLQCSQAVFAQFLGVSLNTVRGWEQGVNPPKDIACRFMDEIHRNPDYWRKRLRESVRVKEAC
jgi:DNA-binding transcriptional regulator YiaG